VDEALTAKSSSFDCLSAYLREAWNLNSSFDPPSFGSPFRTPMWEFVRRAKAHSDLGRLDEFEALAAVERCLRSWDDTSADADIWETLFPDAEDPKAEFIYTWPRIKWAAAILTLAVEKADHLPLKPLKCCSQKYDRFISVVGHLQQLVDGSILVPCRKFAGVLACEPMTISRYRHLATASGLLRITSRCIKAQRKADEFVFAVERFDWKTGCQIVSDNLKLCVTSGAACYTELQEIERKKEIQEVQEKEEMQEMQRETRTQFPPKRKCAISKDLYIPTTAELAQELESTKHLRAEGEAES
jgi:hypothetical protein